MEEGTCALCGAPFRINSRARRTHVVCGKAECQRERRRRAQKQRRAKATAESRQEWADYMCAYRREHPDYRERERAAARRRRVRRNEAGSNGLPARVYLAPGPGSGVVLRVVSDAGESVTIRAEGTSAILPASRSAS